MINKSKKQRLLTAGIFSGLLVLLILPFALKSEAATTGTFNVTLTITNAEPRIVWVNGSVSATPAEGGARLVSIHFNVTDNNSAQDINASSAQMWVNLSQDAIRGNSTCTNISASYNTVTFECQFYMWYWDADGTWQINASVKDNSDAYTQNITTTFSYSDLAAMTVIKPSLSFDGVPAQLNVSANENPQILNNTGNRNFTAVNVTAYELRGITDTSYTVGAGNFSINISDWEAGQALLNASTLEVTGSTIPRGNQSTEDLYVYLDVPTGVTGQTYAAVELWQVEVTE